MKFLVLSFDDGTVYDERFVELLDRYQIPATFNLNSGLDDFVWYCDGHPIRRPRLADKPQIYQNHEVASHTLTHPWLTSLSDEELVAHFAHAGVRVSCLSSYYSGTVPQSKEKTLVINYSGLEEAELSRLARVVL